jgi:phosphoribosylanthranilate isomerase
LEAAQAGADALGFMFYERSARAITLAKAVEIIRQLPPFIAKVGVFVNPSIEEVRRAAEWLDVIQLHGAESPELCAAVPRPVLKAIRVRDEASLDGIRNYAVSGILLDAYVEGQLGGTGARFNWELAIRAKALAPHIVLAGGLTPENIAEAVQRVRPYGVDVSSGVEASPGRKDAAKLRAFITQAKAA